MWNGCYAIPYFRFTPFEVALSAPDAERKERPFREKIRILIILGDSTGINVKADEQLLQKYCGDAEIVTLVEPLRQKLNNYLQDEIGWDILFFSGHSQTQGTQGQIFLNHHDSLTMAELRDTLLPAIAKRLQLAIFNSCDGLGIASELESLQIPQVIVMREPVPDKVAQEFLKHFLKSFTGGSSLCISVGYARQQLQRLESQFPCASWLPVIVQNQLEVPPTWQSLGITRSPYRGLMAFREEDAENFFGREAFVEQLVIDVTSKPLVAVIGASGSGKSSVVFAGLIPQLRQNNIVGANGGSDCDRSMGRSLQEHRQWQIISFRPGKNPFESLAIALEEFRGIAAEFLPSSDAQILQRRQELELEIDLKRDISGLQKIIADILHTLSPTHLLVVIDQFEEVYTLCPNAQERQIFIDSLLNAVNHTPWFTLLITLRADFLGKAMSYQPLGKALQDYPPSLLVPMNRKELERAIIQPAARFSVELEEGLVNKLIDDVGSGEGSLPLQQFALTQLWGKQRPGLLTHQAYTEIGGVTQALANHAEAVYAGLSESQQKRAQRVFIQLVQPGEGTEDTRRLATRDEVGDYWDLVTLLANERLLVTNRNELVEDTVEVVHEALIKRWLRLQQWIDDNRKFRSWQEGLKFALRQWINSGMDEGFLLRGAPLAVAEGWLLLRTSEISYTERKFIKTSLIQNKKNEQKPMLWERLRLILLLSCTFILAWSLNHLGNVGECESPQESQVNVLQSTTYLSAVLILVLFRFKKLPEIFKNRKLTNSKGTQQNTKLQGLADLEQVACEVVRTPQMLQSYDGKVVSIKFSPDNKTIASASRKTIKVWNEKGQILQKMKGHKNTIASLSFSPDGNIIASGSHDGSIKLWSLDGRKLRTLNERSGDRILSVCFNQNGKIIASASNSGCIKLWSLDGRELQTLKGHKSKVTDVTFSPDRNTIASSSYDGTIKLWSLDGREIQTLKQGYNDKVLSISFSPDGKTIASASHSIIKLWNKQGQELQSIKTPNCGVITFSPNSKVIASGVYGEIKIWRCLDGSEIKNLNLYGIPFVSGSHNDKVCSLCFSHDGKILASAFDNTIVL